jgi:hypothetical protein
MLYVKHKICVFTSHRIAFNMFSQDGIILIFVPPDKAGPSMIHGIVSIPKVGIGSAFGLHIIAKFTA